MTTLPFEGSVWCNIDIALRHVETVYKEEAEALGLSVLEWFVMQSLYEHDGQMASQLAKTVGRPPTSFTPVLDKLQNKGFIERRSHPSDRRAVRVFLTKRGSGLKNQLETQSDQIESKLRQRFSDKEWRDFSKALAVFQTLKT